MKSLLVNKNLWAFIFVLLMAFPAISQVPQRPVPPKLANDLAGIFTPEQVNALERRLVSFDDTTSNQIAVVVVPELYGYDKAQLAYSIGQQWGVGNKETNNGLVILVKPKVGNSKGEVFIATGYGLEGVVTDALSRRVIEQDMIPYFKNEDYYGGINAALDRLMPVISGEISYNDHSGSEESIIGPLIFLLFIVGFVVLCLKGGNGGAQNYGGGRGRKNISATDAFILGSILNSSGRGSSGGGSFGGGSFGGFGGGSFGGGGAGGSW